MPTTLSQGRLEEIQKMVGNQPNLRPESGISLLPDSPNTGISSTGNIIDLSNNEVIGKLGGLPDANPLSGSSGALGGFNSILDTLKTQGISLAQKYALPTLTPTAIPNSSDAKQLPIYIVLTLMVITAVAVLLIFLNRFRPS